MADTESPEPQSVFRVQSRHAWGCMRAFSIRQALPMAALLAALYYLLRWAITGELDVGALLLGLLAIAIVYVAVFLWHFFRYPYVEMARLMPLAESAETERQGLAEQRREVADQLEEALIQNRSAQLQMQLVQRMGSAAQQVPRAISTSPPSGPMETGSLPVLRDFVRDVQQLLTSGGKAELALLIALDADDDLRTPEGLTEAYQKRVAMLTPLPTLEAQ